MIINPNGDAGLVCLLVFCLAALLCMIESWRGLGPGSMQRVGMGDEDKKSV